MPAIFNAMQQSAPVQVQETEPALLPSAVGALANIRWALRTIADAWRFAHAWRRMEGFSDEGAAARMAVSKSSRA